jgi:hypothetical protein
MLPAGGIEGGPEKLGKKVTLLFGASKSGRLKILVIPCEAAQVDQPP